MEFGIRDLGFFRISAGRISDFSLNMTTGILRLQAAGSTTDLAENQGFMRRQRRPGGLRVFDGALRFNTGFSWPPGFVSLQA